jgi:beta-phosphoglucomutase
VYGIGASGRPYAWPVTDTPHLKAVIFDFDGTLVDSEPIHGLATREGLAAAGIDLSVEEFLARWVGLPDTDCYLQVALDRGVSLDAVALARVRQTKNNVYEQMALAGEVPLVPGAITLIHALGPVAALGVCSAARRVEIEAALIRHDLHSHMRTIVAVEDVTRSKPDPEGYLHAASRLEVEPASCVAIEDTPRGIEAALAAGIAVVAVAQTVPASRLTRATRVERSLRQVTESTLREALAAHATATADHTRFSP